MERVYNIKNSTLKIVFGDILSSSMEVIVSSDDGFLSMGGGVSGAIRRGCGEEIVNETRKHQPAALGDVVVTSAGRLSQKYIFHAVTISCEKRPTRTYREADEGIDMQRYIIRHSVDKCFRLISALDLSSISFPAIGAGSAGISYQLVATEMASAISRNLSNTNRHLEVELYLMDRYDTMTEIDFIVFFEQMAISIHDVETTKRNDKFVRKDIPEKDDFEVDLEDDIPRQVFVSYSRKDKDIVLTICKELQSYGVGVWIDLEGKYHGQNFKNVIVDAIEKSTIVLFFSSEESNASYYVQQEIALSVAKRKHIIPIILDDSKFANSIQFDLCNIDWIDYKQKDEETMKTLVEDVVNTMKLK